MTRRQVAYLLMMGGIGAAGVLMVTAMMMLILRIYAVN